MSCEGAQKVSDPQFSHFVAPPPLPVINDQSLTQEILVSHSIKYNGRILLRDTVDDQLIDI